MRIKIMKRPGGELLGVAEINEAAFAEPVLSLIEDCSDVIEMSADWDGPQEIEWTGSEVWEVISDPA